MKFLSLQYESSLTDKRKVTITGIDEVGRGSLAGPLVIAAATFKFPHHVDDRIQDSKMLSSTARLAAANLIRRTALHVAVTSFAAKDIDNNGLSWCLHKGMTACIRKSPQSDMFLVDGQPLKEPLTHPESKIAYLIKGDSKAYSIAAASIIAKTYRDRLMQQADYCYPEYGWSTNVGYGTSKHRKAIQQKGVNSYHRISFLSKLVDLNK